MLRITRTDDSSSAVTLRLEGRIAGGWVAVLEEESRRALGEGKELVLDCGEVTFVDAEAREMRRWLGEGRAAPVAVTSATTGHRIDGNNFVTTFTASRPPNAILSEDNVLPAITHARHRRRHTTAAARSGGPGINAAP